MEHQLTWQNLAHQLKILNEGGGLLSKIFSNGILREIKVEDLTILPEYQSGIVDFLISYGVLSEDSGYVAIESPHLEYFLDSQAVNRISVGAVQDSVDQLYIAIQSYQTEKSEKKKQSYLREVQKVLKHVAIQSTNQVTNLKHEIREVYKQEPNLEKKIKLLEKFKEQGDAIYDIIEKCIRMLNSESMFFDVTCDEKTKRLRGDVTNTLITCHNWLSDITKAALQYITQFREMIITNKKLRKLKELYDLRVLEGETDIVERLKASSPLWLNKPPFQSFKVSVNSIVNDFPPEKLKALLSSKGLSSKKRPLSEPLDEEDLLPQKKEMKFINISAIWNRFKGSSGDLMTYISEHHISEHGTWDENLTLFCKITEAHIKECRFNGYQIQNGIRYPLVYAK